MMDVSAQDYKSVTSDQDGSSATIATRALVESLRRGLNELQPVEDRPSSYLMWAGTQLRDFLRDCGYAFVPQTVYQLSSHFYRSAHFFIETLALNRDGAGQRLCLYTIFPGTFGGAEREVTSHAATIHGDLTQGYDYALVAIFRRPLAEEFSSNTPTKILGSSVHEVGAFAIGFEDFGEPTHGLYVAVWRMSVESSQLFPC